MIQRWVVKSFKLRDIKLEWTISWRDVSCIFFFLSPFNLFFFLFTFVSLTAVECFSTFEGVSVLHFSSKIKKIWWLFRAFFKGRNPLINNSSIEKFFARSSVCAHKNLAGESPEGYIKILFHWNHRAAWNFFSWCIFAFIEEYFVKILKSFCISMATFVPLTAALEEGKAQRLAGKSPTYCVTFDTESF